MDVTIHPCRLHGTITAPSSKSSAHRNLICAALSSGTSVLKNMGNNDDIQASLACIKALGSSYTISGTTITVTGITAVPLHGVFPCNESGSTLRFLTPIAAALGITSQFTGKGNLPSRPMSPLLSLLEEHGVTVSKNPHEIFSLSGSLSSGLYSLAGNISSQYISGLLFALPLLKEDSEILLTTTLQSQGYVTLTIETMKTFGVDVLPTESGYRIPGNQKYMPTNVTTEGDYSSAAFWLGAMCLGHDITVKGLSFQSSQADREMLFAVEKFGGRVRTCGEELSVAMDVLSPTVIDGDSFPDSVPILSVVASHTLGKSEFVNCQRLRLKESDRLHAMEDGLTRLGVLVEPTPRGYIINGGTPLSGGTVDSYSDHRIAMALSIAALNASGPVTITNAHVVAKSYPNFYNDLISLGGEVHVL